MKRILSSIIVLSLAATALFQSTLAVLEETVSVKGTSFTVGTTTPGPGGDDTNTSLKFLVDLSGGTSDSNLTDSIQGPSFENIDSAWTDELTLKIHNKGQNPMDLISKSDYISDPDTLRDDIFVEVIEWNDLNNNGLYEAGEEGLTYGNDSILRWKNDTFPIGVINSGEVKGLLLRFNGSGVTDTNFGMNAVYDFNFTGLEQTL